ncbi:uncharacterized protein LOC143181248 [Calliopsis andreniformis]|uniref:uncharacterized protein LOC143181248 n=1 Tax=Calliopsis andreniformis TaxID=337506 RepID=UPI003FCC5FC3
MSLSQQLQGYFWMLSILGVLGCDAYTICKRCSTNYAMRSMYNFTENTNPSQGVPVVKDVSYLPKDDYADNLEKKENEQQLLARDNRNLLPEYRNLCESVTKRVQLDNSEYEYQPPHYYETYCKNYLLLDRNQHSINPPKQKCVHSPFHCVQRSKAVVFVRRRWDNECWEPFVKEIASGCDCMWPVSDYGEITNHYSFSQE